MCFIHKQLCPGRCSAGPSGHLPRSTASWRFRRAWDAPTSSAGSRTTARPWRTAKLWTGWKTSKASRRSRKRHRDRTARVLRKARVFLWMSRLQKVSFGGEYFFLSVFFCPSSNFLFSTLCSVEESGENEKDKVQWLTDRLANSVTDLSRTRQDQTSPNTADKGRWVERESGRGKQISHLLGSKFTLNSYFKVWSENTAPLGHSKPLMTWFIFWLHHHDFSSFLELLKLPSSVPRRSLFVFKLCVWFLARWVKVTVAVGEDNEAGVERQKLATDTEVLTLEQPGRVTGWW